MLRRLVTIFFLASLLAAPVPARAVLPDEIMSNPAQEQRARTLSRELRCMVCQNQSIDDSDAPLARDLRLLVRERIKSGDTDAQVMDFLVARYGAFVLLKPPFEMQTLALWLLPPFALLLGAIVLVTKARRRQVSPLLAQPLTSEEQSELHRLLATSEPAGTGDKSQNHSITKY